MMKLSDMRLAVRTLPALLLLTLLSGCNLAPVLVVAPGAIDFDGALERTLRIQNNGAAALQWTLTEVSRADEDSPWVETDVPWLNPETFSGSVTDGVDNVKLLANVSGLPVGTTQNAGVRIDSNGGSQVIPISITVAQSLFVNPGVLNVDPTATGASFTVNNTGDQSIRWDVRFLDDPDDITSARILPSDIIVQPNPGTTAPGGTTVANVSFPADRGDFALLIESIAGSAVVEIRFGTLLQDLSENPETLRLFYTAPEGDAESIGTQAESTLRLTNDGSTTRNLTIEARNTRFPDSAAPLSINPIQGTAAPNATLEIKVTLDPDASPEIIDGLLGNSLEIVVTSGSGILFVPVVIERLELPEIAVSEPPEASEGREIIPLTTLDFGREEVRKTFYVANTGPRNSNLFFRISHEDQGVENPIVSTVAPLEGDVNDDDDVFIHPPGTTLNIDGQEITVTIDRTNLTQDVEFRTITVVATDEDGNSVLDPVEPATIEVRVERAPLEVEGAINRSRPPFLLRFVFLLRDAIGQVIPTLTEDDLERLDFTITEQERVLDLDETNFFLQGPENLKTNVVLLLDYTGSIYNAGTTNPQNPLRPGEAVEQIKGAAREFIRDLPDTYQVQIMYYADRQQRERVIHPFSTDKESLISALEAFNQEPALFGVSTIRDALVDSINALANEDSPETLPFDEADVRAVVFITDGVDNASAATVSDVTSLAEDARVRLYPLVYAAGDTVENGDMLVLAEDSGGNTYNAPTINDLTALLENREGIGVEPASFDSNNAFTFRVKNVGSALINWSIDIVDGAEFIRRASPDAAGTEPGSFSTVNVTLDATNLIPGEPVVGELRLTTAANAGEANVRVTATPSDVGGVTTILPQDISLSFEDPSGVVWNELSNQLVLTYVTPLQEGADYNIRVSYAVDETTNISGEFEENGVFAFGDVIAGQIAMNTSGIVIDPGADTPEERVRGGVRPGRLRPARYDQLPHALPAGYAARRSRGGCGCTRIRRTERRTRARWAAGSDGRVRCGVASVAGGRRHLSHADPRQQ